MIYWGNNVIIISKKKAPNHPLHKEEKKFYTYGLSDCNLGTNLSQSIFDGLDNSSFHDQNTH